jgi:hypothetical protein
MQHTCTSTPYSRQRTASYMQNISCRLKRLAANFSVFNALRLATRVLGHMGAVRSVKGLIDVGTLPGSRMGMKRLKRFFCLALDLAFKL